MTSFAQETVHPAPVHWKANFLYLREICKLGNYYPYDKQQRTIQYFSSFFWNNICEAIASHCGSKKVFDREIFAQIFGDFRGLIINERFIPKLQEQVPSQGHMVDWGASVSRALLPYVSSNKRYECTACYVLDGRGLYLTALGPQTKSNFKERSPVNFVLCIQQTEKAKTDKPTTEIKVVNQSQLGRLVSLIHSLGTYRIAALRDLSKLRAAGRRVGEFEPRVQDIGHLLQDYSSIPITEKQWKIEEKEALVLSQLKDIRNYFSSIGKDFIDNASNAKRSGAIQQGLLYRIERSQYYVDQFRRNIPNLRHHRIEGFQPYDVFVERRLGSAYEFIRRLGIRFERASNAMNLVDQRYLSIKAEKTESDLRNIGKRLEKIQKYGEYFLVGFLMPYYVISTAHHIIEEKNNIVYGIFVFISAVFICLFVREKFVLDKETAEENEGAPPQPSVSKKTKIDRHIKSA